MSYVRFIVTLAATLAATSAQAAPAAPDAAEAAVLSLRAAQADLGLDPQTGFRVQDVLADDLGLTHVRVQQTYRGLPVLGGQAIVHRSSAGADLPLTDALVRGLQVEASPNLGPAEALAVAQDRLAPRGAYAEPPKAELVVWPEAGEDGTGALRQHLAYHLHAELENGREETRHEDLLVDAHTGAVLKTWSTLFTSRRRSRRHRQDGTPAQGVGNSQYSGKVALPTLRTAAGYELTDPTRGGYATRNLGGFVDGIGEPFLNETTRWGDGQNYDPARGPASPNGQTAAVDVHYGLRVALDFYRNILDRNGLDGRGTGPLALVHYDHDFDNAFWSDGCFCLTFGDGPEPGPLTSLDVVGHEVSHGLTSATAGLQYFGEAGGLNESNSDIFGALMGFYAKGAQGEGRAVPDEGGSWALGETVRQSPYRFMNKPSLDGFSPDEWSPDLKFMDPHLASGPMNRAFYFLAQGADRDPASPAHSRRLPGGMKGIGNDKALRIWWRTLSTRLTPASRYRDARLGALQSARELYGAGSAEEQAVASAFKAVNVGGRKR